MNRDQITRVPDYYNQYVQQVENVSLLEALHLSLEHLTAKWQERLEAIGDEVYAPGKWPVSVILQHLVDSERIFAYRALRFARKDSTPLPGYDENAYAEATFSSRLTIEQLMEELKLLRVGTIYLFDRFEEEELNRFGMANGQEISVAALGFIIAGHQAHHLRIIRERYLPLAKGIISPF